MLGRIPEEVIAEVRERTDIVQVIGQHVQLKRSGANHKGLCPFHNEKTPSFNVNSQRQFYHCFGCGESGDVISFLMKIEGRSFAEVVEDLAARAGVDLPREQISPAQARAAAKRKSERQQGLDLNRKVAKLYQDLLVGGQGQRARDYLRKRGLGQQVTQAFQLGYAPPSGNVVAKLLQAEGVELSFGERLGLVSRRSGGTARYHDRFWNRLIFPVIAAGGEVLGFGGRLIDEGDGPKYINTPETSIYRKGEALFGLEAAAKAIRQSGVALMVEGNVDVLQLHQHGFNSAIAPMGTAVTPRQVLLLKRFAREVVAIFDGDDAGQTAALKSVPTLVEGGISAKIASLPGGHDPDSYLCEAGAEAMRVVIDRALPAVQFMFTTLRSRMEDSIPARARVLEQVAPVVAKIESRAERDLYIGRLALDLDIDEAVVRRAVRGQLPREALERGIRPREGRPDRPPPQAELNLLGILVEHPHLAVRADEAGITSLLTNDRLRVTYLAALQMQQVSGEIDPVKLLEVAPDEVRDVVAKVILSGEFASVNDPTRALDDCLNALRRTRLEQRRQQIKVQMARARTEGDPESESELASQMIEVEREIHETR